MIAVVVWFLHLDLSVSFQNRMIGWLVFVLLLSCLIFLGLVM